MKQVITRVYTWDGQYMLDWRNLPPAGLRALEYELQVMKSKFGINFQEDDLLSDVSRLYNRKIREGK